MRCKLFLTTTTSVLLLAAIAHAASDPNQTEPAMPGWGLWRPDTAIKQADYAAGFSSAEVNGLKDFREACAQSLYVTVNEVPYWFRLSNLIDQIGTGQVEYGCNVGGNITSSLAIPAIKKSLKKVTCLQVSAADGRDIPAYAATTQNSRRIRFLRNTAKVNPGSFPALVVASEGQNWVYIESPVKGWIAQGAPGSRGNLRLCDSSITPKAPPQ